MFPILRLVIALALGMFVGYEWGGVPLAGWLGLLMAAFIVAIVARRWNMVQSMALLAACFALGAFLMQRQVDALDYPLSGKEQTVMAVLTSEPVEKGKVAQTEMRIVGGVYDGMRVRTAILKDTVQRQYQRLHVGDGIMARTTFEKPTNYYDSNFDYPLFLRCRGISATAFVFWSKWQKTKVPLTSMAMLERTRLRALMFRQSIMRKYEGMGLDDEGLAVTMAMTIGEKSRLTKEMRDVYSISGASHVLALSGLHLGIIYALLVLLTGRRRFSTLREILVIGGIWTYAFITGMSPSVVRASIMITVYSLVSILHRDRLSLNTWALTALLMLLWNPLNLYDVGFQMSFMAVFFIIVFFPKVYAWMPERVIHAIDILGFQPVKALWAMVAVSLCAQLGTAPLTMYYFGRFSVYFLLTNMVVIPFTTVIIYLAVAVLVAMFWTWMQQLLVNVLVTLVAWQNAALEWIAALPGSHIDNIHLTRLQVALIYALIAIVAWGISRYRQLRISKKHTLLQQS